MMSCSTPWVISSTLTAGEPVGDLLHILAHLIDRLGKRHGRAFFVQQIQRPIGLDDDRPIRCG